MIGLVRRVLARLLPASGRHRAGAAVSPATNAPAAPLPSRLPHHKSPHAAECAADAPLFDPPDPVRPYVLAALHCPAGGDPTNKAQAERRWALYLAVRGIDVGPTRVHGGEVGAGAGSVPVAA
ncbi:hypothetical protein ACFC0M_22015 [Streptomyces sp. NPDC056149]|uniref:hypothetical protein n=1 Tax=Streptomyces sp. NPDC056149 TaxID=3345728 RepID=UPI0035E2F1AC